MYLRDPGKETDELKEKRETQNSRESEEQACSVVRPRAKPGLTGVSWEDAGWSSEDGVLEEAQCCPVPGAAIWR